MNKQTGGSSSNYFLSWLALLFIALKLTGFVAWSWWWVLAPIWAPISACLLLLAIMWAIVAVLG